MKTLSMFLALISAVPWMVVTTDQVHYQELALRALLKKNEQESLYHASCALARDWSNHIGDGAQHCCVTVGTAQVTFSQKCLNGEVILRTEVKSRRWSLVHEEVKVS